MTTEVRSELMESYNISYDDHDAYACVMMWFFAVAEYLYHETAEEIPHEWQFHHSPSGEGKTLAECQEDEFQVEELVATVSTYSLTDDEVLDFGNWLDSEYAKLREMGRIY